VKTQTWIVIIRFTEKKEVSPASAIMPVRRPKKLISSTKAYKLDVPVLVIPDKVERVEVIPILSPAEVKGRNFRRRLNP